jgi:hypothetical protein
VDQEADLSRLPRLAVGRAVEGRRKLESWSRPDPGPAPGTATLSHDVTGGIIAGQIKALSMILAIDLLIPDRRLSPSGPQPAAPPVNAAI